MDAWVAGFGLLHTDAQVQYSPDGSGAGRTAFLAGAVDFAGSDAYMDDQELERSRKICGPDGAFDVPAYISPIAVAFNLPGITELNLDAETIAKIFQGKIKSWDDPAIAKHNPGVKLPDLPVTPVNRSEDSGTTETFTEYLHAVVPDIWTAEPSDSWPAEFAGENAQGTTGVVSMVAGTKGAVTYADDSAVGAPLGKASLKVGDGFVPVSAEAAATALDQAKQVQGRPAHDLALKLDRATTAAGAYPLMLVLLPHLLHHVSGPEQGGPGQGLRALRPQPGRPGRRREIRQERAAVRGVGAAGRGLDRPDQRTLLTADLGNRPQAAGRK